ncbi:hypothetical protein FHX46_001863 [Amycolatopsis viridis]|uniref:Uncharacterized protein n=1 Tax=Amycolatopsis viridis TaxID=185678 RepID=A0ABX0SS10_9PSEU|nr:hypothetical protein [Amycolatopsis viridis]
MPDRVLEAALRPGGRAVYLVVDPDVLVELAATLDLTR